MAPWRQPDCWPRRSRRAATDPRPHRVRESGRAAYANAVYLATVANGAVTGLKLVAEVDENAILKAFFGGRSVEGSISAAVVPGAFDSGKKLPVRIDFATDPVGGKLTGRFANAGTGIRGAGSDALGKQWTAVFHGTPTAGPSIEVHLVTGGGGAC